jgi:hypothetical protein
MTKKTLKFKKITTILLTLSILLMTLPIITTPTTAITDTTTKSVGSPEKLQEALENEDITTIIIIPTGNPGIILSGGITIREGVTLIVEGRLNNYYNVFVNLGKIVIENGGMWWRSC